MLTLPSSAKITEAQLVILSPDDAPRNPMNMKLQGGAKARELWSGSIAIAPSSAADLAALLAWLEQFDGRLTAFGIPMAAGFLTLPGAHTATVRVAGETGDATLALEVLPASGTIKAGTLLTLGDPDTDAYQVVEVLADAAVPGTGDVTVEISPRLRWEFNSGETVTIGATVLRVRLVSDELDGHGYTASHGVVSLQVVEGVYA